MGALDSVLAEYAAVREKNELALAKREAEVFKALPELREIREKMRSISMRLCESVLENPATADSILESGQKEIGELKNQEAKLLAKHPDYAKMLELEYDCGICRDSGYVKPGIKCKCLYRNLVEKAYDMADMPLLKKQNFKTFDLSIFPEDEETDGLSQRERMKRIHDRCKKYADDFPDNEKKNILLCGETGLGKTYLVNCIAKEVLDKGYTVLNFTAYRLLELLRDYHIGKTDSIQSILKCDLLIIDDLGSEPLLNNISREYLFTVLNERVHYNHTIIATNLNHVQVQERYGERISSRILNPSNWNLFSLKGKDIRLLGK